MTVVLSPTSDALLGALETLLAGDLHDAALIGGLAVTIRVAGHPASYRATNDIDLVTTDADPSLVEVLAERHETSTDPVVVDGVKVDVIPTFAVSAADLEGIGDGDRLFVAGHRWALETAESTPITTPGRSTPLTIMVATPPALVAMKSHAVGFARAARLAQKHGADLLDVYELVELFDRRGELAAAVSAHPGEIASVIAHVVQGQFLANPARAVSMMAGVSPDPLDVDVVTDALEEFVVGLA